MTQEKSGKEIGVRYAAHEPPFDAVPTCKVEDADKYNEVVKQLEDARKTIEFYAERSVWGNGCAAIDPCDTYICDLGVLRGGKKAREFLERWK
jgi:hypothetical protein